MCVYAPELHRIAIELYTAIHKRAINDNKSASYVDMPLSKIIELTAPAKHSPDYRCVCWYGSEYCFSPGQAAVVKKLWQAWTLGIPRVGMAYLLEACDMLSDRLSDLFKKHPAWGTMIQNDGNGLYWLQPCDKPSQ